jgi:DNA repair protein RadC
VLDRPEDVLRLFPNMRREKREHFCLVMLDAQNQVITSRVIHIGTLTMSVVGPREVFREAIREGASAIVVVHNHPSGDVTPSVQDLDLTEKLMEVGYLLDIPLLDHVIIGDPKIKSFRQSGLLKEGDKVAIMKPELKVASDDN